MSSERCGSRPLVVASFILAVLISGSSSYSYDVQHSEDDHGSQAMEKHSPILSQTDYISGLLERGGLNHLPEADANTHGEQTQPDHTEEYYEQPHGQYGQTSEQHEQSEKQQEQPQEQYASSHEQSEQHHEQPQEPHVQPEEESEEPQEPHEQPEEESEQQQEPHVQPQEPHEQPGEESEQQQEPHVQPQEPHEQPGEESEQQQEPHVQPQEPHEQPGEESEQQQEPHVQPGEESEQSQEPHVQPQEPHEQPGEESEQSQEPHVQPQEPHEQPGEESEQSQEPHVQPQEPHEQPEEESEEPQEPHVQPQEPLEQPEEESEQSQEPHEQPEEESEEPQEPHEQPEEESEEPQEPHEQPEEESEKPQEPHEQPEEESEEPQEPHVQPQEPLEQPEEESEEPQEPHEQPGEESEQTEEETAERPEEESAVESHSPEEHEEQEDSEDSTDSDSEESSEYMAPKTTTAGTSHKPTGVTPVTTTKTTTKIPTTSHKPTGVTPVTTTKTTTKIPTTSHKPTGVTPVTTTKTTTKIPTTPQTVKTTTHATPPEPVSPRPGLELCDACVIIHGVGYAPFPGHCNVYIQCRFIDNKPTTVNIRKCPHGLQWNQNKLTCDFKDNVKCIPVDSCPNHKAIPGDRSAYLVLYSHGWTRIPCPPKKAYSDVTCGCTDNLGGDKSYETCEDKKAIPGTKRKYLQLSPSGWIVMPCPPTLGYDEDTCRCTIKLYKIVHENKCKPTLRLTFDGNDATDSSLNKFWVNNKGVTFNDGKAYFNGKARLIVPGLSNMDLGSQLYILVKYKQTSVSKPQTLIANGDCSVRHSVSICSGAHNVHFYAETNAQITPAEVTMPKDVGQWQRAMYVLDGEHLQGYVGNHYKATLLKGSLERRPRGLVIGGGGNCGNLHGIIDMIAVYKCKPEF